MTALKITSVGNSAGVLLPKELFLDRYYNALNQTPEPC